jgi:gluconate 2-dehydrogenase gamma chain
LSSVSRRNLVGGVGALGATALARGAAGAADQPPAALPAPPYRFFNPEEAAFVEPAVDRLIPPDERWPGAREAGVSTYIDQQLAGAYGQGARLYAAGPWDPGTPSQGYQLPLNPAQLYRTALAAIAREMAGRPFGELPPEQQDSFLTRLEQSQVPMEFPSAQFFDTLLANTVEGFFADPMYGGNRDMVGWRMIGFPGAYAAYLEIYTSHGLRFDREPLSIGSPERGSGMHTGAPRHG